MVAHFEALIKGVLMVLLKNIEKFFLHFELPCRTVTPNWTFRSFLGMITRCLVKWWSFLGGDEDEEAERNLTDRTQPIKKSAIFKRDLLWHTENGK